MINGFSQRYKFLKKTYPDHLVVFLSPIRKKNKPEQRNKTINGKGRMTEMGDKNSFAYPLPEVSAKVGGKKKREKRVSSRGREQKECLRGS